MNQDQRQQIKRYLDILLRRKIIIVFCLIISIVIGLGVYLKTPKLYRSTSLIMYQQKINPTEMSPDTERFQEIVGTVSQQILSRTSLENLINQFGLYKNLRAQLPMEDVVDIMKNEHITIKQAKSGNTFEVSYQGSNPRTVLLVTNALAAKFIEENIRYREESVSETSSYIKDELNMAKTSMNKKDAAMRDYKLQYYNEMPQQLDSNVSRLNALQSEYQNYQNNLQDLERTKVLIQEQMSLRYELLSQISGTTQGLNMSDQQIYSKSSQLKNLRLELKNLQTKYTDKHPDVKRLKSLIAELEADMTTGSEQDDKETGDPQIAKWQQQLDAIEYNMKRINTERDETKRQIEKYKKWIEAAPVREAEWAELTRDYEQLNKHYETLVSRSIQADSAESLEKRQKGSQFKIVDPARLPETPFQPNFIKIMFMVVAIGFGLGGAIAFSQETLDTSFRDAHDLEKFLGLPVACSIPVIKTSSDKRRDKLKSVAWAAFLVFSLATIGGGMAYLWIMGVIVL